MEYWERLDEVIQREPIEPRDIFFHAMLRPLGLEKGKRFNYKDKAWRASGRIGFPPTEACFDRSWPLPDFEPV
jgi:hypothetical protein